MSQESFPYLAIGNSEPLPEGLPEELKEFIRQGRTAAGWCDHGQRFGICPDGCTAPEPPPEAGAEIGGKEGQL